MNVLQDKLGKIVSGARFVGNGWRLVSPDAATGLLASLVAEIDETIFPRRIEVKTESGDILAFEAAHRRLRRFVATAPDSLRGYEDLFETQQFDAQTAPTDRIKEMLTRFLSGSSAMQIRTGPLPAGDSTVQAGLSAAELAIPQATSPEPEQPEDPADAVSRFHEAISGQCTAWAQLTDGQLAAQSDPGFDAGQLAQWAKIATQNPAPVATECSIFGSAADPAQCVVMVRYGACCDILQTSGAGIAEIHAIWRSATA